MLLVTLVVMGKSLERQKEANREKSFLVETEIILQMIGSICVAMGQKN